MDTENITTIHLHRLLLDFADKNKIMKTRKNFCIIES